LLYHRYSLCQMRSKFFLCIALVLFLFGSGLQAQEYRIGESLRKDSSFKLYNLDALSLNLGLENLKLPEDFKGSLVVFDTKSHLILLSHEANSQIPPASLTKLMTLALVSQYLDTHKIDLNEKVQIEPEAWAINAPPHSSLMFLGPEQDPSWQDLLLGLAVSSGNDAAIAVAQAVSGSVEAFVNAMNRQASALGLENTHFVEPSGYSELNITTAQDFARFLDWYLESFPQNLQNLHSVEYFTYPNQSRSAGIRQRNRNQLLWNYPGADGLKTGYIDESGYNLAFTAQKDGMRLAGVILGADSETQRTDIAIRALDWGFKEWIYQDLLIPSPGTVRTFHALRGSLSLKDLEIPAVLPRRFVKDLVISKELPKAIIAPWPQSVPLGTLTLSVQGLDFAQISVHLDQDLLEGPGFQNFGENIFLFFSRLWNSEPPLGAQNYLGQD